jgi:hypothetical protein
MIIPKEFDYLVSCFHRDSLRGVKSEQDWISSRLKILDQRQKDTVRKFLDDLLARTSDGVELRRIWKSANPDWAFPDDEHLRTFLGLIRQQL